MQFIYFLNVQEICCWLGLWMQTWRKFYLCVWCKDSEVTTPKKGLTRKLEKKMTWVKFLNTDALTEPCICNSEVQWHQEIHIKCWYSNNNGKWDSLPIINSQTAVYFLEKKKEKMHSNKTYKNHSHQNCKSLGIPNFYEHQIQSY